MPVAFVLHGVHGGGKSFISRPIAEDVGAKFVVTDAADRFPEVIEFDPIHRQLVYTLSSLQGYSYALGITRKGKPAFLDFGPLQSIPYIRWFLGRDGAWLEDFLLQNTAVIEKQVGSKVVNIFFVVKESYEKVLERIRRRARPGFLKEESNPEYLRFIDQEMKSLARRLEEEGKIVETVPADAPIVEKVGRLWSIVTEYL